jgi:hypothetical protein
MLFGHFPDKKKQTSEYIRLGKEVAAEAKKQREWNRKNEKEQQNKFCKLTDIEKLDLVKDYFEFRKECLDSYKVYLENVKLEQNKEDNTGDNNAPSLAFGESETVLNETKAKLKKSIEPLIDGIQDPIIKEFIASHIELIVGETSNLPEDVLDREKLANELSLWNELIERREGREIGMYGFLEVVQLNLTAWASIKHEAANTKVSLIRRALEDLSNDHEMIKQEFDLKSKDLDNIENELQDLVLNLIKIYTDNPEKLKTTLRAFLEIKEARKSRNTLILKGRVLAIFKISGFGFFILSVVGMFILFSPIAAIVLAVSGAITALISAKIQYDIGYKQLPRVDYIAESAREKLKTRIGDLQKEILLLKKGNVIPIAETSEVGFSPSIPTNTLERLRSPSTTSPDGKIETIKKDLRGRSTKLRL